jgi:hypothetical protein
MDLPQTAPFPRQMSEDSKAAKRGKKQINKGNPDACGNSSDGSSSDCEVPADAPRKTWKACRPSVTQASAAQALAQASAASSAAVPQVTVFKFGAAAPAPATASAPAVAPAHVPAATAMALFTSQNPFAKPAAAAAPAPAPAASLVQTSHAPAPAPAVNLSMLADRIKANGGRDVDAYEREHPDVAPALHHTLYLWRDGISCDDGLLFPHSDPRVPLAIEAIANGHVPKLFFDVFGVDPLVKICAKNENYKFSASAAALDAELEPCWRAAGKVALKQHRGRGLFFKNEAFCLAKIYDVIGHAVEFNNFNTFVADVKLAHDRFYYEVHVIKLQGVVQFGVCTDGFEPAVDPGGRGVGDDSFSFAVDGVRQLRWPGDAFGSEWADGHVIGFAIDMREKDRAKMSVSVNGSFAAPNGLAFDAISAACLSPAFSASFGTFRINFGDSPFKHYPPDAFYVSVHQAWSNSNAIAPAFGIGAFAPSTTFDPLGLLVLPSLPLSPPAQAAAAASFTFENPFANPPAQAAAAASFTFENPFAKTAAASLAPAPAPYAPHNSPLALSYTAQGTGRRVSISLVADGNLLTPTELRARIKRPLDVMQAQAWFFAQRSPPGCKSSRQQPLPPRLYITAEYHPCIEAHGMFGLVTAVCQRVAAAPVNMRVICRTTWRWADCVLDRVTRGRVSRVQVMLQRHACLSCHYSGCLTSAAANAGRF